MYIISYIQDVEHTVQIVPNAQRGLFGVKRREKKNPENQI